MKAFGKYFIRLYAVDRENFCTLKQCCGDRQKKKS